MNIYTVCLFGHRRLNDVRAVEDKLFPVIRELIKDKRYIVFLIGRNGEFDEVAASVIKRVQREDEIGNSELILVLPYKTAQIEYYENYHDGIIIPETVIGVHPKRAIELRNRYMADSSDFGVGFVENRGGAYTAVKYAEGQGKKVIYLSDSFKAKPKR